MLVAIYGAKHKQVNFQMRNLISVPVCALSPSAFLPCGFTGQDLCGNRDESTCLPMRACLTTVSCFFPSHYHAASTQCPNNAGQGNPKRTLRRFRNAPSVVVDFVPHWPASLRDYWRHNVMSQTRCKGATLFPFQQDKNGDGSNVFMAHHSI